MAMDLSKPTYVVHSHNPKNSTEEGEGEESKKQIVLVAPSNATSSTKAVRYRECLKNHAASMGGTATDGCGEFMPSGEEGSLEALRCSACSCHRNFHRKEGEGEGEPAAFPPFHHQLQGLYHYRQQPAALIMPLGATRPDHSNGCAVKKRVRTKFTQEQKERMLGFAERVGWKMQRQEEGSVQQLCQEIGVKRRVLKVWMHNNKHTLANSSSNNSSSSLHIQ